MRRYAVLAAVLLLAAAATVFRALRRPAALRITLLTRAVPADGRDHPIATLAAPRFHTLRAEEVQLSGLPHLRLKGATVLARAPVTPAQRTVRVTWRGASTPVGLAFREDTAFSAASPSLPEWLPLHAADDRVAFRHWFTALAERAADAPANDLPPEIADCAALLRYAYREALRQHDDRWFAEAPEIERVQAPSVTQWTYPNTPLHAGLFRTSAGRFTASDLTDNTFAQFADAKTLVAANTFFVSRDLHSAHAGDLLFYRLLELDAHHHSQYHSIIVTGGQAEWVVYHTGPVSAPDGTQTKGEMRRVLLRHLLHHPDLRWRPTASNPNFLGVYRWDLLAEE